MRRKDTKPDPLHTCWSQRQKSTEPHTPRSNQWHEGSGMLPFWPFSKMSGFVAFNFASQIQKRPGSYWSLIYLVLHFCFFFHFYCTILSKWKKKGGDAQKKKIRQLKQKPINWLQRVKTKWCFIHISSYSNYMNTYLSVCFQMLCL